MPHVKRNKLINNLEEEAAVVKLTKKGEREREEEKNYKLRLIHFSTFTSRPETDIDFHSPAKGPQWKC